MKYQLIVTNHIWHCHTSVQLWKDCLSTGLWKWSSTFFFFFSLKPFSSHFWEMASLWLTTNSDLQHARDMSDQCLSPSFLDISLELIKALKCPSVLHKHYIRIQSCPQGNISPCQWWNLAPWWWPTEVFVSPLWLDILNSISHCGRA